MSIVGQCNGCKNALENCICKSDAKCVKFTPEQVYKELPEDFTRTDIERHIPPVAVVKKQPTLFDLIADISDLVETTPNDVELGAAVRKLFSQ